MNERERSNTSMANHNPTMPQQEATLAAQHLLHAAEQDVAYRVQRLRTAASHLREEIQYLIDNLDRDGSEAHIPALGVIQHKAPTSIGSAPRCWPPATSSARSA
jgi:hypothetical protein